MEGWRSWGVTQKLAGDKYKHEPREPKKLQHDHAMSPALFVVPPGGGIDMRGLVLWQPTVIDENNDIVDVEVVAMISLSKTDEPCIPLTFQVSYSAVDKRFQKKGYGSLIYGLAFHYVNSVLKGGLTSDHSHSTTAKATKMWNKFADTKGMVKKKTAVGNDEFDYNEKTADPDDDCDFGTAKRTFASSILGDKYRSGMATDNSWIMTGNNFSGIYEKLKTQHEKYLKSMEDSEIFEDDLILKAIDVFQDAYPSLEGATSAKKLE